MSDFDVTPAPRDLSVCSATAQDERCPMGGATLAIDVSHYQGAIDWRAVAAWSGPGGFAYVKLTEGQRCAGRRQPRSRGANVTAQKTKGPETCPEPSSPGFARCIGGDPGCLFDFGVARDALPRGGAVVSSPVNLRTARAHVNPMGTHAD